MKSNNLAMTDVVVHGAQQSGNFSIAANGKAFKILIDGLYSNKIQAIVRELSSNAFDAQIAASRGDKPFDLQLPNLLDPTFSVRDYGTSLSHDDIMGLYTTVFQSTKEDTNNAVGKFGLGSKTPFAYTDSFTVTAFMRGTKRVYGAYINVNGIPQISLMASEDTNELDGLMVSFPVNSKDCEQFRVETERVVRGFDVKPNVRGNQIDVSEVEPIYTGSCFKIFKGHGVPRVRQGCVIYPINTTNLPKPWNVAHENIFNTNILIDFPIGDLDVTPSRETLSYDDVTIKNIMDRAALIDAEIVAEYSERFAKVRTYYEAQCFQGDNGHQVLKSVQSYLNNLVHNGRRVNPYKQVPRDRLKHNYGCTIMHHSEYDVNQSSKTLKFKVSNYHCDWSVNSDTMFIIEHPGKKLQHINARIRNNLNGKTNVVWIKNIDATPRQLRKLKKLLGYPLIHDIADLKLPERRKPDPNDISPRIKKTECRIERFKSPGSSYTSEDVVNLEDLDKDTRYIVAYSDWFLIDPDDKETTASFYDLSRFVTDLDKLIIVRRQNAHKFKTFGFTNALIEARDKLFAEIDFEKFKEGVTLEVINDDNFSGFSGFFTNKVYTEDTSYKKVLDFLEKYGKKPNYAEIDAKVWSWKALVPVATYQDAVKQDIGTIPEEDKLSHWIAQIQNDYPLTKYILATYYKFDQAKADELHDYITIMDHYKKEKMA
jgi:ferritin